MEEKKTVSLCMIVKNEEKYLRKCLESVKDIVDEMIIVDTGSTDKTVDIAKEFNAKIIYYKWKNDFADARNVSLEYAKMDWILLMDGDDQFDTQYHSGFRDLIKNDQYDIILFNTASFAGEENGDIINNLNIRLIRNNKKYKYQGAIHEQIVAVKGEIDLNKVINSNIVVYHYGYLNQVATEKNKRDRNISIIKSELEKDPENIFHLFNLGNEYFAMWDHEKALECYEKAYKRIVPTAGYSSKLVLRRASSLIVLGRDKEALKALDEGIGMYPEFTDLLFQKAIIYLKHEKYLLSMKTLEKCIEQGDGPLYLSFLAGSGTYKALESLGEIYFKLKDYNQALNCYKECINLRPNKENYIFNILNILIKKKQDEEEVDIAGEMEKIVGDKKNEVLKVLLDKGMLNEYDKLVGNYNNDLLSGNEYLLLKARRLFYSKKYIEALGYLSYLEEQGIKPYEISKYKTIIFLLTSPEVLLKYVDRINVNEEERAVLKYSYMVVNNIRIDDFDAKYDSNKLLNLTMDVLREVLFLREFELFEKLLQLLNHIINDYALLKLAKLYDELGFGKLAAQEVVRAIKTLGVTDPEALDILKKNI